ncbi:uncharacterized protein LOC108868334 [Pyrus x bretschneideri]|uniref:uncharacterized protein LOC108868334 n=1 Tax=Pyrus x bretschneideri TaxID=225117 RepID=UPI002030C526|nr:uncharacterized protein LOC108868334 [Pyrus x bretschneideri]
MNPEEICLLKDLIGAPFIGLESDTGRRNHHPISKKKKMQSFKAASTNPEFYSHSYFYFRRDDSDWNQTRFTDLRQLEQSITAFPHNDAVVLSPSSMFSLKANNVGRVPDRLALRDLERWRVFGHRINYNQRKKVYGHRTSAAIHVLATERDDDIWKRTI